MQLTLRLILLAGAIGIIATVLTFIHKKRILMNDATGWVCVAALLLLFAIFPDIIVYASFRLGFQSPANFVFLIVTGLLVVRAFRGSARMSLMRHRIDELAQEIALLRAEAEEKAGKRK